MIFQGQPGLAVYDITNKKMLRFDKDGKLEVHNRVLVAKLKKRFPEFQEAQEPAQEQEEVKAKIHICKYCGAEFDNVGVMLSHIRKEHKADKEG